jgi:hypothetical protein
MASATVTVKVSPTEMDLIKHSIECRMRTLEARSKDKEIPAQDRHNDRVEHLGLESLLRQLA